VLILNFALLFFKITYCWSGEAGDERRTDGEKAVAR
jgi:hypothetical protein